MTKVKGIIWDVGGTMVIRTMLEPAFVQFAFQATGLRPAPLSAEALDRVAAESRAAQLVWRTLDEEREGVGALARALLGGDVAAEADVDRLRDQLCRYYDVYAMVAGLRGLLDDLAERGVPMAVVSEWPPSLRLFLAHHDLLRYFPVVVGTADEGLLKPHPQLIQRALDGLGLSSAEVVYIGDHPAKDIEPARAMGLPTIHFNPKRTYEQAGCYAIADLRSRLAELIG